MGLHEVAHLLDPEVERWAGREAELPAMAAEEAARFQEGTVRPRTPVQRSIRKYGPQFTGKPREDISILNAWIKAIRGSAYKKPGSFAYPFASTQQSRLSNLQMAYRKFLTEKGRRERVSRHGEIKNLIPYSYQGVVPSPEWQKILSPESPVR